VETCSSRAILAMGQRAQFAFTNPYPSAVRLAGEPGGRVRENIALRLQLPVLAAQPPEGRVVRAVLAHSRVTIGLRNPVDDRLRGCLEPARKLLKRAPRLQQLLN